MLNVKLNPEQKAHYQRLISSCTSKFEEIYDKLVSTTKGPNASYIIYESDKQKGFRTSIFDKETNLIIEQIRESPSSKKDLKKLLEMVAA